MWATASLPYNRGMDTATSPSAPRFAVAGSLLEALAARDFDRVSASFEDAASLSALLPRGLCEWQGAAEIGAAFFGWFGDHDDFEVVDASVGQVGSRLQLRWRVRVRGARFDGETRVAEQHAYADTGATGRIRSMVLLCSGFCTGCSDV